MNLQKILVCMMSVAMTEDQNPEDPQRGDGDPGGSDDSKHCVIGDRLWRMAME